MAANKVFYNPKGYVQVIISGEQTAMSYESLRADAQVLLDELKKQGKKQLALIDITNLPNFTAETNKAAMRILESVPYDAVAIFGANKVLEKVTRVIILAIGKSANTRIFPDEQSAATWLLSR